MSAISPSSQGAASELTVSADLLRRGASVYRSLSPAAAFDLVAAFGDRLIRVEVKSRKPESFKGIKGDVCAFIHCDIVRYRSLTDVEIPELIDEPEEFGDLAAAYKASTEWRRIPKLKGLINGIMMDPDR